MRSGDKWSGCRAAATSPSISLINTRRNHLRMTNQEGLARLELCLLRGTPPQLDVKTVTLRARDSRAKYLFRANIAITIPGARTAVLEARHAGHSLSGQGGAEALSSRREESGIGLLKHTFLHDVVSTSGVS